MLIKLPHRGPSGPTRLQRTRQQWSTKEARQRQMTGGATTHRPIEKGATGGLTKMLTSSRWDKRARSGSLEISLRQGITHRRQGLKLGRDKQRQQPQNTSASKKGSTGNLGKVPTGPWQAKKISHRSDHQGQSIGLINGDKDSD